MTATTPLALPDREGLRSPFAMLHHVALITNDMPATVAFYRDVLGSEVALAHRLDRPDAARHYFITVAPNLVFAFFEFPDAELPEFAEATVAKSGRALDHICFFVETAAELDAWQARLAGGRRAAARLRARRQPVLPRPEQHHLPGQRRPAGRRDGLPGAQRSQSGVRSRPKASLRRMTRRSGMRSKWRRL